VEVDVGAEHGPQQVEPEGVDGGADGPLHRVSEVLPAPALEVDPPALHLAVAGGGLQERPPHRRRPLVALGHGRHQGGQPLVPPAARRGRRLPPDHLVEDGPQHALLRAEAGVDRLHRHAGPSGQRRHRGSRPPCRAEQLDGGVDDVLAGLRRLRGAPLR
jgi:hypothetical protein